MVSNQKDQYTCIREKQLGKLEKDVTQLKVRADFKEESIKEVKADIEKMNDKLDAIDEKIGEFVRKSIEDDFNIDNRVTALESTVRVLKWASVTSISFLGVLVAVFAFALTHLH